VPRQARHHPPGVPGRRGGPARRAQSGPQHHRAPDDPLRRRRRGASYQAEGHAIREEDITRFSPVKHRNLNLLGRYSFTASTPAAGALRPLSDADALELDEDDEGAD
jgi:hypothetical protein